MSYMLTNAYECPVAIFKHDCPGFLRMIRDVILTKSKKLANVSDRVSSIALKVSEYDGSDVDYGILIAILHGIGDYNFAKIIGIHDTLVTEYAKQTFKTYFFRTDFKTGNVNICRYDGFTDGGPCRIEHGPDRTLLIRVGHDYNCTTLVAERDGSEPYTKDEVVDHDHWESEYITCRVVNDEIVHAKCLCFPMTA